MLLQSLGTTMRDTNDISFDDFDELNNPRPAETDFDRVVDAAISRRGFLSGVLTFGAGSFILGTSSLVNVAEASTSRFGFDSVAASIDDTITVPQGYEWDVALQWGDKLWSDTPEFDEITRGTAASQARAFGDNNDGMAIFSVGDHTLLVANNEYTNREIIWGNRAKDETLTDDDILKGMYAHGVSVVELTLQDGKWKPLLDSPMNRRITPKTPMDITGPAAGHVMLQTTADPSGTKVLGTWNNCANGKTPWGTYLACEENFNGYFSSSDETLEIPAALKRYGVSTKDLGYAWARIDDRFDIAKNPNEPNRAGYVVEIDPTDPTSTPKKHSALGRFKHENADVQIASDGRIVVYMGDDERGEYLYRYVSNGYYAEGGDTSDLLTAGTLFAAKFTDDQRGEWLALTPETTGMSAAEICIHTRQAASAVGATTMDRPEWVTSNPKAVESYVALTNNKNRGKKSNAGGDETPVGGPNPRAENKYGQIVRWVPDMQDHASDKFSWDIFALAGNPDVHADANGGSANINAGNMFNSPDGLAFDSKGLLWILTDGNYKNEGDFAGMGNNQMLVGDPATGEIRRFLTGPNESEITGITWSPDGKTAFVGVQHPGEEGGSNWPNGGTSAPRSAIITVRRTDDQPIG
jgi:secreted PhoX family phosphatase